MVRLLKILDLKLRYVFPVGCWMEFMFKLPGISVFIFFGAREMLDNLYIINLTLAPWLVGFYWMNETRNPLDGWGWLISCHCNHWMNGSRLSLDGRRLVDLVIISVCWILLLGLVHNSQAYSYFHFNQKMLCILLHCNAAISCRLAIMWLL